MTAIDVRRALERRYSRGQGYAIIHEVPNGSGAHKRRTADCIVMDLWPSRGLSIIGVEIKVSRSDLLHELKQPKKWRAVAGGHPQQGRGRAHPRVDRGGDVAAGLERGRTCCGRRSGREVVSRRGDSRRAVSRAPMSGSAAPDGLAYLPYQQEAIDKCRGMGAWSSILLADEPGLGKTIVAAGMLNCTVWHRALIVCPASLRINWKRELDKWLVTGSGRGDSLRRSVEIAERGEFPGSDVVIASYEFLARHLGPPREVVWDWLIVDEAHALANPRSQRTTAILGRKRDGKRKLAPIQPLKAHRKLFMTGTPIVNRPIEIQPVLAAIDRMQWGNRHKFAVRYCAASHNGFGWDYSGASNLEDLERRLRDTCMIRRSKADVLKDLPPKRWQVLELPEPDGGSADIARERELLKAAAAGLDSGDRANRDRAIAALHESAKAKFSEISALRKRIGVAMIPQVIEIMRSIGDGEKAVVFAHHLDVIAALAKEFGKSAVKLDGADTPKARDAAVRRFQDDLACQWFIGSIRAAGVGLTLTAAHRVIMAELDWTPGAMQQTEDRCHRYGQRHPVLIQYLVTTGSINASVARVIVDKQRVIDAALDGGKVDAPKPEVQAPAHACEQLQLPIWS